jgi:hypothetical protein
MHTGGSPNVFIQLKAGLKCFTLAFLPFQAAITLCEKKRERERERERERGRERLERLEIATYAFSIECSRHVCRIRELVNLFLADIFLVLRT